MSNSRKFRVAVIGLGWWGQTIVKYLKNARNIAQKHAILKTFILPESWKFDYHFAV